MLRGRTFSRRKNSLELTPSAVSNARRDDENIILGHLKRVEFFVKKAFVYSKLLNDAVHLCVQDESFSQYFEQYDCVKLLMELYRHLTSLKLEVGPGTEWDSTVHYYLVGIMHRLSATSEQFHVTVAKRSVLSDAIEQLETSPKRHPFSINQRVYPTKERVCGVITSIIGQCLSLLSSKFELFVGSHDYVLWRCQERGQALALAMRHSIFALENREQTDRTEPTPTRDFRSVSIDDTPLSSKDTSNRSHCSIPREPLHPDIFSADGYHADTWLVCLLEAAKVLPIGVALHGVRMQRSISGRSLHNSVSEESSSGSENRGHNSRSGSNLPHATVAYERKKSRWRAVVVDELERSSVRSTWSCREGSDKDSNSNKGTNKTVGERGPQFPYLSVNAAYGIFCENVGVNPQSLKLKTHESLYLKNNRPPKVVNAGGDSTESTLTEDVLTQFKLHRDLDLTASHMILEDYNPHPESTKVNEPFSGIVNDSQQSGCESGHTTGSGREGEGVDADQQSLLGHDDQTREFRYCDSVNCQALLDSVSSFQSTISTIPVRSLKKSVKRDNSSSREHSSAEVKQSLDSDPMDEKEPDQFSSKLLDGVKSASDRSKSLSYRLPSFELKDDLDVKTSSSSGDYVMVTAWKPLLSQRPRRKVVKYKTKVKANVNNNVDVESRSWCCGSRWPRKTVVSCDKKPVSNINTDESGGSTNPASDSDSSSTSTSASDRSASDRSDTDEDSAALKRSEELLKEAGTDSKPTRGARDRKLECGYFLELQMAIPVHDITLGATASESANIQSAVNEMKQLLRALPGALIDPETFGRP